MIIYSTKTLKNWMAGRQFWFFAIIHPKYRGDLSVVDHEKEHIAQWWMATGVVGLAVAFGAYAANAHMGVSWEQLAPLIMLPPSTHGLAYLMLRSYRLKAEVLAYRKSLLRRPDRLDIYANALATKYKLKITTSEARELLK